MIPVENFECRYYEQAELWEKDLLSIPAERERILETIALIPPDVRTILDVGCGNGAFLNSLPSTYEAVGLDFSEEALKYVRTKAVRGNVSNLPFGSKSFDLVTCLEVLEHLPSGIFEKAISEIQRVAKKYIIVSVPNSEDLHYHLVRCPECCCWFNPNRHVRSFNVQKLAKLFEQFTLVEFREIGPLECRPKYNLFLYTIYRFWKGTLPPPMAICPQCGYQAFRDSELVVTDRGRSGKPFSALIMKLLKIIAKLFRSQNKRRWLLLLYTRKE